MKETIEDIVISECRKQLTPKNIRRIAKEVVKIAQSFDDRAEITRLEGLIQKAQEEKENQMVSLRACKDDTIREMIFDDLGKIGAEMKEFEKQLELEKARHDAVTEEQIIEQLSRLADGDADDIVYRKSLIRLFVNKIFLYDDKFTITFNTGDDEVTITDKLLSEIEEGLNGKTVCFSKEGGHQQQADIPFGGCPPVVL